MSRAVTTFIYCLKEPDTDAIRYIGKSDNPFRRYGTHLRGYSGRRCQEWLAFLRSKGKLPVVEVLEEVPQSQWPEVEREYIRVLRAIGFRLVNEAAGGQGTPGTKMSAETRRKMSAASLGRPKAEAHRQKIAECNRTKVHHPLSKHQKALLSTMFSGEKNPFFGRKHSAESLSKMSHASRLRKAPAHVIAMRKERFKGTGNPFYGRKHTPESLEKIRQARRQRL